MLKKGRIHSRARQRVIGALTVSVLLLCIAFTSMIVIIPERAGAAYTDFTYYKLLTIDHTKVNGSHTNFVVFLCNTSNDFNDTSHGGSIQPDGDDIAFYSFDNGTQYKHDIEIYNGTSGEIAIWVNISDAITNTTDFKFLMYYSDADGSDQRDMDGTWGPEFAAVWHMNESDAVNNGLYDSSGYGNNASCDGATPQTATRVSGRCGYAIDFSGKTCYYLNKSNTNLDAGANDFAVVGIFKKTATAGINGSLYNGGAGPGGKRYDFTPTLFTGGMPGGGSRLTVDNDIGDNSLDLANNMCDGGWHCVYASRENNAGGAGHDYLRMRQDDNYSGFLDIGDFGNIDQVGRTYLLTSNSSLILPGPNGEYLGDYDELWFVKGEAKNQSWASTLANNTLSPETFVTFGSQYSGFSSFSLEGLEGTGKNVTWVGARGETVWSNATGGTGGTMDIYMVIFETDNVTDIRVYCDDLDATITASNIAMEVSSDNTTWSGNTVSFSDGGSNITINSSQWANSWCNGANPFSGAGLTDKTAHIYCRFTLAIPAGGSSGTYSQSDWKVYPGHYV